MKPLTLDDRERLLPYFSAFEMLASELSFTNLFMWRHKYHFHYTTEDGYLFLIRQKEDGSRSFSQPIGPRDNQQAMVQALQAILQREQQLQLLKVDAACKEVIASHFPKARIEPKRDAFDYLYSFSDLRDLAGNAYHKKRNHINQFLKLDIDHEIVPLTRAHIPAILNYSDRWLEDHPKGQDEGLISENRAIHEALDHFEDLSFTGAVLYVENEVKAFTFGEPLNTETLVIHIEKADTDLPGLYPMINQRFLQMQESSFELVNREQDLGIPGLRRAKESYHPVGFIEKFTIRL